MAVDGVAPASEEISDFSEEGADRLAGPASSDPRAVADGDDGSDNVKSELICLLHYHLDLFDHYQPTLGRPYETLKRFFKIYIRDFDGAKELREQLMRTKNTDEVRQLLENL